MRHLRTPRESSYCPLSLVEVFRSRNSRPISRRVAELQKQKYLPSLNNPAAAVGNILDALKGKPKTDAEPLAGEKPNPVKGILDLLGGQKKEQPSK